MSTQSDEDKLTVGASFNQDFTGRKKITPLRPCLRFQPGQKLIRGNPLLRANVV